jgi:hypothetical protein
VAAFDARPRSDWPTTLVWAFASLVVTGAGGIVFTLIGDATIRAVQTPVGGRTRIAAYAALSSVVAIALGLAFASIVSIGTHQASSFARSDVLRLLAGSLFAPPMLAVAVRESIARRRRRDLWGLADIAR